VPRLRIELVPRPLWGKTLAKDLPRAKWRALRTWALERTDNACEVCGFQSHGGTGLMCHEVWSYDDERGIQTSAGMEIHCSDCDRVTHFGRTTTLGRADLVKQALSRLGQVNNWSDQEVRAYVRKTREVWLGRNGRDWTQDRAWYEQWLTGGRQERLRG
jgi:hypothetical protein